MFEETLSNRTYSKRFLDQNWLKLEFLEIFTMKKIKENYFLTAIEMTPLP